MVHVFVTIFRRDLRVYDNTALEHCFASATEEAKKSGHPVTVLPVFFYREDQTNPERNPYFGEPAFGMLNESVNDLDAQLSAKRSPSALVFIRRLKRIAVPLHPPHRGVADSIDALANAEAEALSRVCREEESTSSRPPCLHVFFNRDVTPYSRQRDSALVSALFSAAARNVAPKHKKKSDQSATAILAEVQGWFEDYTLFPMDDPLTKSRSGSFYTVFKFLYDKRRELHQRVPRLPSSSSFHPPTTEDVEGFDTSPRQKALHILNAVATGQFDDYEDTRNDLARDVKGTSTTRLSRFLKFGCISIREVYWAAYRAASNQNRRFDHGTDHPLIRELYFREFYYIVAWFRPDVLKGMTDAGAKNIAFHAELDANIPWTDVSSEKGAYLLEAWKHGRTGVPIVDAGMRQLLNTGFMHNRCRMITAMFLTKDLLIDWREGELHFARHLVDYDPVQNNAGWQWSASVGNDAAPYFRIFNPFLQQARFDPDGIFTTYWVPELATLVRTAKTSGGILSKWDDPRVRALLRENASRVKTIPIVAHEYPDPIVSHKESADVAKHAFSRAAVREKKREKPRG